jgi:hypothetical protein
MIATSPYTQLIPALCSRPFLAGEGRSRLIEIMRAAFTGR